MPRILIGIALIGTILMSAETAVSYTDSIKAWQKHRDAGLRIENSWLTLVGLFWLKPGDNTIGSAATNDFVLPKSAPAQAPAGSSPFAPPVAACLEWTDGCRVCQRAAGGPVSCSNVGIACVPKAVNCTTIDAPTR